jgi:protein-S-isoprenylcysteine O-methyltransferase Ste14
MSGILKQRAAWPATLQQFRQTIAYDVLTRIPLIVWFGICGMAMLQNLGRDIGEAQGASLGLVLSVLARTAGLSFVAFVMVALLFRMPPVARSHGVLPRVVAIGGTFSVTVLALFPRAEMSPLLAGASLLLILLGNGLACYAITHLGRSLSMMAEARKLVMSGPYGLVRHPLYAAEAIASLGFLIQFLSPAAAVVWVAHLGLQCCRMHYEEGLLRKVFPEYDEYRQRVARVLPGVY